MMSEESKVMELKRQAIELSYKINGVCCGYNSGSVISAVSEILAHAIITQELTEDQSIYFLEKLSGYMMEDIRNCFRKNKCQTMQ